MLTIEYHTKFKKDYKKIVKRGCNIKRLEEVIGFLVMEQALPEKYQDHALADSKYYKNMRECHIQPDWLLIYQIKKKELILALIRSGSHNDLF